MLAGDFRMMLSNPSNQASATEATREQHKSQEDLNQSGGYSILVS